MTTWSQVALAIWQLNYLPLQKTSKPQLVLVACLCPVLFLAKPGWDPRKNPEQNPIFEILIKILLYQSSFYEKKNYVDFWLFFCLALTSDNVMLNISIILLVRFEDFIQMKIIGNRSSKGDKLLITWHKVIFLFYLGWCLWSISQVLYSGIQIQWKWRQLAFINCIEYNNAVMKIGHGPDFGLTKDTSYLACKSKLYRWVSAKKM